MIDQRADADSDAGFDLTVQLLGCSALGNDGARDFAATDVHDCAEAQLGLARSARSGVDFANGGCDEVVCLVAHGICLSQIMTVSGVQSEVDFPECFQTQAAPGLLLVNSFSLKPKDQLFYKLKNQSLIFGGKFCLAHSAKLSSVFSENSARVI